MGLLLLVFNFFMPIIIYKNAFVHGHYILVAENDDHDVDSLYLMAIKRESETNDI